jgi:hypothetical protein
MCSYLVGLAEAAASEPRKCPTGARFTQMKASPSAQSSSGERLLPRWSLASPNIPRFTSCALASQKLQAASGHRERQQVLDRTGTYSCRPTVVLTRGGTRYCRLLQCAPLLRHAHDGFIYARQDSPQLRVFIGAAGSVCTNTPAKTRFNASSWYQVVAC